MDPLEARALARLLRLWRQAKRGEPVPDAWEDWLRAMYPRSVRQPFADQHRRIWEWAWAIEPTSAPDPLVAILARGGGKSSTAELVAASLGLRGSRAYAWYVRETQERADDSLRNVAALLESKAVERHYPHHADRLVSKYGHSKGWNSTRLRTAGGFTIDAIGLDTAARGLKVEDDRPDLMILDDLDAKHDTEHKTAKKIATLTDSVLGAGMERTAILAIQNLIIPHGIFARMADGRADWLVTRRVIGPVPAIEGMRTEIREDTKGVRRAVIVAGRPTWKGQDIPECQRLMDRIGLRAFDREAQHQVRVVEGAIFKREHIRYHESGPLRDLVRVAVGVDPSGGGDEIGIITAGLDADGIIHVRADDSQPGAQGVKNWTGKVVGAYDLHGADGIAAEANFGGNMVESAISTAAGEDRYVPVKLVTASRGKEIRAEPVALLYEEGRVVHDDVFPELEQEMTEWVPPRPGQPKGRSPNRMDALVWAVTFLVLTPGVDVGFWFPGSEDAREAEARRARELENAGA